MRIGELAQKSGLTTSKIRFYERIGLLKAVDRRSNGYRTYSSQAVTILGLITTAQRAGFALDEIRTLLPSDLQHWDRDALMDALTRKIADIEALQARLTQSKAHLLRLVEDIQARPEGMDCAANAHRVLTNMLAGPSDNLDITPDDLRLLDRTGQDRTGQDRTGQIVVSP
ncbi:MerR family transcriptional regulator [Gluconobacter sphaericus]|uniref:MerR family transcriptional regulator n=1 Tax=Gluconobacter sphaericus NBRC 12467 TaxID=1307951 RepID=A0AA37SES2_9PROT|nr:MerR family transcriptional regulator [Gluconobacter sphaericus]MBF0886664.1 MerR family DNA-binding transcriptional regulator [Gluconobacter sphaericus]GBR56624.1 MerR family transcriptional regulator [Gluconobacter sphaericus NBRC 12467]GEB43716.1 MerR family transcriptional regulator [Gluconobacter sphaericus NBRC 12467]GLQ83965.1 MerR family transcriptional regulator [Gluconobacter sphaericus NBRC 12467]